MATANDEEESFQLLELQNDWDSLMHQLEAVPWPARNEEDYAISPQDAHEMHILPYLVLYPIDQPGATTATSNSGNAWIDSNVGLGSAVKETFTAIRDQLFQLDQSIKTRRASFLKFFLSEYPKIHLAPEVKTLSLECLPTSHNNNSNNNSNGDRPKLLVDISIHHSTREGSQGRDQHFLITEEATLLEIVERIDCALERAYQYCQLFGPGVPPPTLKELEERSRSLGGRQDNSHHGSLTIDDVRYVVGEDGSHLSNTRLKQLRFGLRQPYRYEHCGGSCIHFLTFDNVRRWHPYYDIDIDVSNQHIREVWRARKRRKRCQICDEDVASWLVYGDRLSPVNPCWQCDICFRLLHYDDKGHLVYSEFQVFPYHHDI